MQALRRRAAAVLLVVATCLAATAVAPHAAAGPVEGDGAEVYVGDGTTRGGAAAYAQMMSVPSKDTGWVPSVPTLIDPAVGCPPRRCVDRQVPVPAGVKVSGSMVRVLLPSGYHKKKNRKQRYPVVYLYNGALSSHEAYSRLTLLTSMSKRWKAIFVMPEGGHGEYPGMFSDWVDGSYDWESFHIKVLIPWVDNQFRTIPGGRAAAGLSMGGMGALIYAERHPKLFKGVLSMSGVADTSFLVGNSLPPAVSSQLGLLPPDLTRVWGNPVLDRANWAAHNPAENVAALKKTLVLISSGTGFPGSNPDDPVHTGQLEQTLWTTHRTFLARLAAEKVPFKARIIQGGVHAYPWFDAPMRWGLPQLIEAARS